MSKNHFKKPVDAKITQASNGMPINSKLNGTWHYEHYCIADGVQVTVCLTLGEAARLFDAHAHDCKHKKQHQVIYVKHGANGYREVIDL